jgi:diguanylate cyclase (GGDEF)-like protein/PAS domain S-box-containing protein
MLEHYTRLIHSELFTKGPVVVFIWKNQNNWPVQSVSKNIQRILGYSESDFLSGKISYDSLIHPEDFERIFSDVAIALEKKEEFFEHKPYRIRKKDGSYLWVHDSTLKLKTDSKVTHLIGYLLDITAQKALQQELEDVNLRWSFAIEGNGDGLWDWNVLTSEVYFSKQWKNMLGYEEYEIKNNVDEWKKLIHPDDIQMVFEDIKNYFEGKTEFYENIHRLKCKDGTYKWILDRGVAIKKDEIGKPIRLIGTHRDINKQKILENDFETIFETTKDGIAILDLETNFLHFNSAYLDMTGFTAEELKKKSCISMSIPEDVQRAKNIVQELLEKGFVENFEKTCIVKNNKIVNISMSLSLMPDKQRILAATKDITTSKKTQKQMQNYINLINENIITSTTNLTGVITDVSEAFCKISKYKKVELIGQNHNIIRHSDMPKTFFSAMWKKIESGQLWTGEVKNLAKDGSSFWVYETISTIYDEENQKKGYTAISHDITHRKKVEELSITDKLTGVHNRLKLDSVLTYELNQSKRYQQELSLIILDVDDFKSVNDNFGHQTGDSVLKEISSLIKSNCRQTDTFGRWGGEEFLIILPKTDMLQAAALAEKLKNIVQKHDFLAVGYQTCSFGVSTLKKKTQSEQKLVEEADKALYEAKRSGKNRVVISR